MTSLWTLAIDALLVLAALIPWVWAFRIARAPLSMQSSKRPTGGETRGPVV